MRGILFFVAVVFSNCLFSQYTPIWTVPSNYSGFGLKAFEMNENGMGLIVTRPYNGGPVSDIRAYTTSNFGASWDSTFFPNKSMMDYNGGVTEGGNLYFSTLETYTPSGSPNIQIKVFNGSTDGGQTWFSTVIDTIVGANKENSIKFMNDTVGTFFYQNGIYITTDFGQTWERKTMDFPTNGVALNDSFMYFGYNTGITFDLNTNIRDSFFYESFAEGQVYFSVLKNNKIYRSIDAQNGNSVGSQYNNNYSSLNIDELPLGDQKVIHFPQSFLTFGLNVTNSCIHLILGGRYVRSCDGGNTFYRVDAFNGSNSEAAYFMRIVNDTLGFIIAKNLVNNEWRLWKTTNGGGVNGAQILTNTFTANLKEEPPRVSFEVYPNPSAGVLKVRSNTGMEKATLYALDGRVCFNLDIKNTSIELDASALEKGTYMLKIIGDNGGESTQKIILD